MGQGGQLILVNGTKYDWTNTYIHSYQMNAWQFPGTVPAGTIVQQYVEWDQDIFDTQSDDAGEATYSLDGTSATFQVQARAGNGFDLQVAIAPATAGTPANATIDLGWNHDGFMSFVLAGVQGSFITNTPPPAWMQASLGTIGQRTLRQLCIPGSHDAGMSTFSGGTAGAFACNTQTQTQGILGQLQTGSRYFDIRPVIAGGQFTTGHYSQVGSSWQGANGQTIASIIADVNAFTASNAELIVLDLSHDLDTDLGNESYAPFNQDQWNALLTQLQGLNHRFVTSAGDLTTLPLESFIGAGQAAVVVIIETAGVSLGSFANQGFYPSSSFPLINEYSDTNDVTAMANDQLSKLRTNRPNPNATPFLLSWTLTQDATEAATCELGTASSILDLAAIADPQIFVQLLPACSAQTFPNVLLTDNVPAGIAALAMAVNTKAS